MALNGMDAGIILITLVSVAFGIYRGFIRETVTIISIIISGFVASIYGKQFGSLITFVDSEAIRTQIASSMIFSVVFFAGFVLKLIIVKSFNLKGVAPLDRLLGFVFGAARAVVVVVAVMLILPKSVTDNPLFKGSVLLPKFEPIAKAANNALPKDWNKFPELEELTNKLGAGKEMLEQGADLMKQGSEAAKQNGGSMQDLQKMMSAPPPSDQPNPSNGAGSSQ